MKYFYWILLFALLSSCDKTKSEKVELENGNALFYTDIFVAANCTIDSVSVFIDDKYAGKLINSFLPLSEVPDETDTDILLVELPVGEHSYKAVSSGCVNNIWAGTITVSNASCQKINLRTSSSNP